MPDRWQSKRWEPAGTNSGGDPVFRRVLGGGENTPTVTAQSYEDWTKEEIQNELEARGLPKTGNKPELIEALRADDGS